MSATQGSPAIGIANTFGVTVAIDSPERNGSFSLFGENDHDIALFENAVTKSEETINHIALKFDGSA
jgi:hypothetical protein